MILVVLIAVGKIKELIQALLNKKIKLKERVKN